MRTLLTGGCGYIGSHTAVELLGSGYDIVIADDLSNSSYEVKENIELITGKKVPFVKADVSDKAALEDIFKQFDIGAVIHFAALKSIPDSMERPLEYYKNNIGSVLALLEVMEKYGCRVFVFSSSAAVYGVGKPPFTESSDVKMPTNPYGRTKLMSEHIIEDYSRSHEKDGFSAVLLRYFNPAGAHVSGLIGESPLSPPGNLFPIVAQTAVGQREYVSIFGADYDTKDGTGIRDYIHIMDLAAGHVKALEYAVLHKGIETFNLGVGKGCSVKEVIESFERAAGASIPVRYEARREGDVAESWADAEKAAKMLDWRAERGLDDMSADALRWQRSILKK